MGESIKKDGKDLIDLFDYDYYNLSTSFPSLEGSAPCNSQRSMNKYFIIVVYFVVCFLSLVGNSLVVLVVCYNRLKRTSTDVYLLNLAIADLLFAITLPFWAVYKAKQWIFGLVVCKAVGVLQEINFYSGIILLACISVDRYLAIVHATEAVTQKRHLVKYICLGIWIFSFFLSLPILIYRNVFTYRNAMVCSEDMGSEGTAKWRIILRVGRHTIGFFIPLIIMVFCYGFTIKTLFQTKSNQKHRAMKVIFAVVIAFIICWLPYNVTIVVDSLIRASIVNRTCEMTDYLDTAISVTEIIGYTHSCINPILYAFIGQKFRNSFLRILANQGIIKKEFLSRHGYNASFGSTSGNTSTTL